jgi:hypothetical protein|tara:strand:+ start:1392 stop:1868 length:477 start_codon:yes stop_codon:yes gene_type:complete
MNFEERKKKNRIQGYDLSHEEVAEFYDDIDFWKSAAEKSYVEGKYVHMAKPSNKAKARSVDIRCKVSKEEFLEMYEQHKRLIKTKRPESDGRLCRYCYNRFTFMTGFKRTNVSIDRLDSDKGYEKGNIVFSCGECNDRKNQISIDMCKRVVEVANEME